MIRAEPWHSDPNGLWIAVLDSCDRCGGCEDSGWVYWDEAEAMSLMLDGLHPDPDIRPCVKADGSPGHACRSCAARLPARD